MTSAAGIVEENSIGASEIAGVIGISPWLDNWQVYARKRHLIVSDPPSQRMRRGLKLQRVAAEIFTEETGLAHEWHDKKVHHAVRRFQHSTVDALVPTIRKPEAVLEIKTAGLDQAGEWDRVEPGQMGDEDGIPAHYLAQVQWQMSTHELDLAYVAVLIAGDDLRVYKIRRDPEIIDFLLIEGEKFFCQHILAGVEPPPGVSDDVKNYIKRTFPREKEPLRPATKEEIVLLEEYADLRFRLATMKPDLDRKEELEVLLKLAVKDAEGLEWPRGKFTYKKVKDHQEVNWERLAKSQIDAYPEDVQNQMKAEYTDTEPGTRRIYFKDFWREAKK